MVKVAKTVAENRMEVVLGHIPPQPPYPPQPELRAVTPPHRHMEETSSDEESPMAADFRAELADRYRLGTAASALLEE